MTSRVVGGDAPGAEGAEGAEGAGGIEGVEGVKRLTVGPGSGAAGAADGSSDIEGVRRAERAEGVDGAVVDNDADADSGSDSSRTESGTPSRTESGTDSGAESGTAAGVAGVPAVPAHARRRPPSLTTDTARPEGGGRAAAGDASAPARQWPLLTVLGLTGLGLLIVGTDLFPQSFRVGTMLVGIALLVGAALRRALPSVGMLAVRSRFTDMVTYGVMGGLIVLLALMVQPDPWLKIPFLEDILHLTIT
ncbi:DUF3017 domain-containing protein [Streptomyces sp. NPDC090127]|uniref:DUF3017 domain-containing protein n=1 Tax=Streptomyces sp. NPDC090127 TaxID=3365953 RepID=UPI00382006BF